MALISVIIVTYNNAGTIKKCVDSITDKNPGCQIVVVDNNSTDLTCRVVESLKSVNLITSNQNLGFSKGVNLGVKHASGDYLVILNPDTILRAKNGFNILVDDLINHKKFGLVGPKFINNNGSIQPSVRNYPTMINAIKEYIFHVKAGYDFYTPYCNELCKVETIYGACLVMSRNVYLKIGGLDERFFMYYEEFDLCRRLERVGLQVGFEPRVELVHEVGYSGKGQTTPTFLVESAKKYHGRAEFHLIQLTLRLGKIFENKLILPVILGIFSYWFLTLKLFSPTIFTSLTVINGINTIRGYGEAAGMPYLLNWLLTNKIQIVVVGTIQWLSYFQPSLYFNGWTVLLILPAIYGFFRIVTNKDRRLQRVLVLLLLLALPGSLYYPDRVWTVSLVGWLFMGILTCYGIAKFTKR